MIKDQNHGIPPACFMSSFVNPNERNVMHRPHNIERFTVTATTQSLYWSCVAALHICLSRPTNKQVSYCCCPVTIGCPMSCKHGPAKDTTRNGVPQFLPRYSVALTCTHTHAHTGCFCSVKTTSEASVAVTAIQGQHVTSLIKQKVTQSRFSIAAFFENIRLNTIQGFHRPPARTHKTLTRSLASAHKASSALVRTPALVYFAKTKSKQTCESKHVKKCMCAHTLCSKYSTPRKTQTWEKW